MAFAALAFNGSRAVADGTLRPPRVGSSLPSTLRVLGLDQAVTRSHGHLRRTPGGRPLP